MESSDIHDTRPIGRIVVTVLLAILAVGACIGAFAGYRYSEIMADKLENKQKEYDAVISEKQSLASTIAEQGQAITDLDREKHEAENKLQSLEDALK